MPALTLYSRVFLVFSLNSIFRMYSASVLLAVLPCIANAFPWALEMSKNGNLDTRSLSASLEKRVPQTTCPTHLTRQGAAPYSSYYPSKYTGAQNGQPGTGKGGVLVPAAGDTAHAYVAPSQNDLRGPW